MQFAMKRIGAGMFDYIHYNPVKHGLASRPGDWAWSSFGNAVSKGWYEESWGANEPTTITGMDCE